MTTQATHTPGPWQHVRHGGYEFLWANGGTCPLGVTFQRIAGLSADMQDANARLIAAAPEMLEALRGLEQAARAALDQSATADGLRNCDTLARARAAIAKAEGRAE